MRPVLICAIAFAVAGVFSPRAAAQAPPPEMTELAAELAALEADARLGGRAPAERARAHAALLQLGDARRSERESEAIIVRLRIATARAAAESELLQQYRDELQRENDRLQLAVARRDAAQARAELEMQRLQAQIRAEEAERARQDAEAARMQGEEAEEAARSARAEATQAKRAAAAQKRAAELARKEAELEAAVRAAGGEDRTD